MFQVAVQEVHCIIPAVSASSTVCVQLRYLVGVYCPELEKVVLYSLLLLAWFPFAHFSLSLVLFLVQ